MGQKIHPEGFRVGYIHDWKSTWYEEKNFADVLQEDLQIRDHITNKLSHAGLSNITIERRGEVAVDIHTARPGIVIGKLGQARGACHEINLLDNRPVCLPPRQIPRKYRQFVETEIQSMIEEGVIAPSASPWCAYPVLVRKKDGGIRFAVDYRKLNDQTKSDKMPLPNIEMLFANIEGSKYFGLLDLRGGFWQIPLRPDHQEFTAFRVHFGQYHFLVMPFGLKNAPATFQRWIFGIFWDMQYKGIQAYLDDILIHSKTEDEFVDRTILALERIEENGGQFKISKCDLHPEELEYLGHVIRNGERRPQPKKVEPLRNIKDPENITELKSIYGTLNFYRQYISNFADKTYPLQRLMSKKNPFDFTSFDREIIQSIANELADAVLGFIPSGGEFRLETDASDYAWGGVLYNKAEYDAQIYRPLLFVSKSFNPTEQRWSTFEKEAAAIVGCLEACDPYVRGRPIQVKTDHKNLVAMIKSKNRKVATWASKLSEYDIDIDHVPGEDNIVADFLSRSIHHEFHLKDTMFFVMA